jgi:DNA-binding SARP family transcriptional activator
MGHFCYRKDPQKYIRQEPPREPWGAAKAERALLNVNQALTKLQKLIAQMEAMQPLLPDNKIMAHNSQHWCLTMDYRYSKYDLYKALHSMQRFQRNLQRERDIEVTQGRKR